MLLGPQISVERARVGDELGVVSSLNDLQYFTSKSLFSQKLYNVMYYVLDEGPDAFGVIKSSRVSKA
jgi:hypothetical protein